MLRIWKALFYSLDGLRAAIRTEAAVREEVIALLIAIPAAFVLARSPLDYVLLVGVVLVVLAVELLNTAVEKLADHVTPERHSDIKYVKDLGSAAVLAALVFAGSVWLVIGYLKFLG